MSYILLGLITTLWCVFHSLLIALSVTEWMKRKLSANYRFYRAGYNVFALVTLLPVIGMDRSLDGHLYFDWDGAVPEILRVGLLILCLILFVAGGRQYSMREFLGLNSILGKQSPSTLKGDGGLHLQGIHRIIRHPWYLASIIIIWLRSIDHSAAIVNLIFSSYLVIGAWLEERKLLRLFGDEYRQYQREVSMLIPWKGVLRLISSHKK